MQHLMLSIFRKELSDPKLGLEDDYRQHPNWTSLRALIMLSEIERQTKKILSPDALRQSTSLAELATHVQEAES